MPRAPLKRDDGKAEYHVYDEKADSIAGQRLIGDDGERAKTIRLTPAEAAFGIANGSIGTADPETSKRAQRAVESNLGERIGGEDEGGEGEGRGRKRRRES